jgi:hypothetical protein
MRSVKDLRTAGLQECVGFSSGGRLVARNIVTTDEYSIHGNNIARLEMQNVSNHQVIDVDKHRPAGPKNLDIAIISLRVELNKGFLFMPVIVRGNDDDNGDSRKDGNALNPVNRCRVFRIM